MQWIVIVLLNLWKARTCELVFDYFKEPDYVLRVEMKQFSLGDVSLFIRDVIEHGTSLACQCFAATPF